MNEPSEGYAQEFCVVRANRGDAFVRDGYDSHCDCWWDGDACCACGKPAMTDAQKRAQGMDI